MKYMTNGTYFLITAGLVEAVAQTKQQKRREILSQQKRIMELYRQEELNERTNYAYEQQSGMQRAATPAPAIHPYNKGARS
jgi:hypothetical protein